MGFDDSDPQSGVVRLVRVSRFFFPREQTGGVIAGKNTRYFLMVSRSSRRAVGPFASIENSTSLSSLAAAAR